MTKRKDPKDFKPNGRRPLYTDPDVMQEKINKYFDNCKKGEERTWIDKRGNQLSGVRPIPPTLEGMAIFLGFSGITAMEGYQSKPRFKVVLTRARAKLGESLHNSALLGEIDPRYSLMIAARIDPAYRKQVDVQVNEDASKNLAEAIGRVKKAKKAKNESK